MENKIYNSFSTEISVSSWVYKLIIYIYTYLVIWRQLLHKNVLLGAGFEPARCMHTMWSCDQSTHQTPHTVFYISC